MRYKWILFLTSVLMMAGCNPTKVIEEAANGKFAYEIGACGDDDKLIWFKDNSVEILNHELKNIKGPKRVSGVKAKYFAKKTRHGWYELRYNVANVSVLDKRATSGQIILKLVYKSDQDLRLMSGAIPFKKKSGKFGASIGMFKNLYKCP